MLSGDERHTLENWVRRRSTAQGLALRARIVLACAQGGSNLAVAARLGVDRKTVTRWRARFLRERLDGLTDDPRPGVPRTLTDALCCAKIRRVALTCGSTLDVRAYPPHLSVNDPGVRLAGAPGAQ